MLEQLYHLIKKVIELVEKLTLGFEIETDFIEDCATYIKTFKTKSQPVFVDIPVLDIDIVVFNSRLSSRDFI